MVNNCQKSAIELSRIVFIIVCDIESSEVSWDKEDCHMWAKRKTKSGCISYLRRRRKLPSLLGATMGPFKILRIGTAAKNVGTSGKKKLRDQFPESSGDYRQLNGAATRERRREGVRFRGGGDFYIVYFGGVNLERRKGEGLKREPLLLRLRPVPATYYVARDLNYYLCILRYLWISLCHKSATTGTPSGSALLRIL